MDYIEKHAGDEMKPDIAARLSNAMGAYKALCMVDGEEKMTAYAARSSDKPEPTPELDGDTEFERVIMTIPADAAHMVKITHIFNKHLTALRAVNAKPYNTVMEQLKELAKS